MATPFYRLEKQILDSLLKILFSNSHKSIITLNLHDTGRHTTQLRTVSLYPARTFFHDTVPQWPLVMFNSCDSMDYSLPDFSVREDSSGKNTGVGCHFLLQGLFPNQGSNPGLLHCSWSPALKADSLPTEPLSCT